MDTPPDMEHAGRTLTATLDAVSDDDLDRASPCEGRTVGQVIAHLTGLTVAFRAAAEKEIGPLTGTDPDAAGWPEAPAGWRDALAEQVPRLVQAWQQPAAWEGMTQAGGTDLPGEVAGLVALDEVVLHTWDLSRAIGAPMTLDEATAAACLGFVESFDEAGTPGLFGPAVPASEGASALERLVARSGRDPHWTPPAPPAPPAPPTRTDGSAAGEQPS